jgi:hypothetical protein
MFHQVPASSFLPRSFKTLFSLLNFFCFRILLFTLMRMRILAFHLMRTRIREPTTNFFLDLDPPVLKNEPLRLPPFHFDANLDPAFTSMDQDPAFFTLMRIRIQLPKMMPHQEIVKGNITKLKLMTFAFCCFFTYFLMKG